jgi:diguanylate cyclase (GGDEF)-like protein
MYDPLIVDTFIAVQHDILPEDEQRVDVVEQPSVLAKSSAATEGTSRESGFTDITASSEETVVLYDLARSLAGDMTLEGVTTLVSNQTRRIVPTSTCVIYTYDSGSDELACAHAAGESAAQFSGLRILRGQRLTGWVAANKQTILNSDPVLDLGEVARLMRPRLRSCLSTPLLTNDDLLGVLTLYSPHPSAFSDDHRRVIEAVAKQVAPALKQAIQHGSERSAQMIDSLAGLPNRQQLRRFIQAEIAMEGVRSPLSLVLVSVDRSSAASDSPVEAIGRVVDLVRSELREGDILFRYAVDELVVLLTQTDASTALATLSKIGGRLSAGSQTTARSHGVAQRVSLGCASSPTDGVDADELLNTARRRATGMTHIIRSPSVH